MSSSQDYQQPGGLRNLIKDLVQKMVSEKLKSVCSLCKLSDGGCQNDERKLIEREASARVGQSQNLSQKKKDQSFKPQFSYKLIKEDDSQSERIKLKNEVQTAKRTMREMEKMFKNLCTEVNRQIQQLMQDDRYKSTQRKLSEFEKQIRDLKSDFSKLSNEQPKREQVERLLPSLSLKNNRKFTVKIFSPNKIKTEIKLEGNSPVKIKTFYNSKKKFHDSSSSRSSFLEPGMTISINPQ